MSGVPVKKLSVPAVLDFTVVPDGLVLEKIIVARVERLAHVAFDGYLSGKGAAGCEDTQRGHNEQGFHNTTVLSGTIAALRFMSFEQSSFRNDNHITRPQVDVVLKIRARKEIVVVEDVKRLDAIDFPAQLDALFGGKWAEPAGNGDRLHEVEPLLHHERTGSENFTGNEYFGFEIGVFGF